MIDPNKTYRTRDGRAVRIYATDGGPIGVTTQGAIYSCADGWEVACWTVEGAFVAVDALETRGRELDLVEVTLADELTEQIPWEALRPGIQWVAMNAFGSWRGYEKKPEPHNGCGWVSPRVSSLSALVLPGVDTRRWLETLCKRPEGK